MLLVDILERVAGAPQRRKDLTMTYQKDLAVCVLVGTAFALTPSVALALDWSEINASYQNPNGEQIHVPQADFQAAVCADEHVACAANEITFTAPNAAGDTGSSSEYRRAEMRVFAASNTFDDDGSVADSSPDNNFVLGSASVNSKSKAGGVNAAVVGQLSIDRLWVHC